MVAYFQHYLHDQAFHSHHDPSYKPNDANGDGAKSEKIEFDDVDDDYPDSLLFVVHHFPETQRYVCGNALMTKHTVVLLLGFTCFRKSFT
jgi:hypothetical protein